VNYRINLSEGYVTLKADMYVRREGHYEFFKHVKPTRDEKNPPSVFLTRISEDVVVSVESVERAKPMRKGTIVPHRRDDVAVGAVMLGISVKMCEQLTTHTIFTLLAKGRQDLFIDLWGYTTVSDGIAHLKAKLGL
jgi:hypothetical protein